MKRRTVLTAVAAGSLAGCLTSASTVPGRDDTDSPDGGDSPSGTDSPGDTDTPDDTATPTFGACPSFSETADRTVCWTDRGDADVYLQPSRRTFAASDTYQAIDTVTFTLHNEGDAEVQLNPYDWAVERARDGGWTHVAPGGAIAQPLLALGPGDSYEWRLATTEHPSGNVDDRREVVADLPAVGTYAFRLHGTVGSGDDAERVEWVARFEYVLSDQG